MSSLDPTLRALALELSDQIAANVVAQLTGGALPVPPEYLTPVQLSQLTGFSVKALEVMRSKRLGPPFKKFGSDGKNGAVRYRLAEVRAWMEAGAPGGPVGKAR